MSWTRRLTMWALVLGLMLVPLAAQAQGDGESNREAARQLGRDALEAFNGQDYATALDKFQRAHQLVRLTSTGLYVARSLEKLGRLVEASDVYLEVTRIDLPADAPQQHVVAQSDAVKERKALLPRIPQLTIVVEGASDPASVKVTIDGSEVPSALLGAKRPTDPGSHTVEASIGGQTKRETVALAEGEQKQVRLTLDATAPPPDGPPLLASPAEPGTNSDDTTAQAPTDGGAGGMQRTLGYVSLGIGGAALIVGAITGGVALKTRGDLNEACEEVDGTKLCGPDEHDQVDTYNTMRIVSGATLIAGGVFAAAGLVSLLTAPSDDPQGAAIRPLVWPGGVGVAGSF